MNLSWCFALSFAQIIEELTIIVHKELKI